MSFLSDQRLAALLPRLIKDGDYNAKALKSSAYELSMGDEYYTTNNEASTKTILSKGEQFAIEPGQFALLLTKETIEIPRDKLGFISIKAGIKFKGLINVSGFHVDPGFEGKLKFSVYNAGSKPIILEQGQRLFPLWLSELTDKLSEKDDYDGVHQGQLSISSEDVSRLAGVVVSPSVLNDKQKELNRQFNDLKTDFTTTRTIVASFTTLAVSLSAIIISKFLFVDPTATLQQKMDAKQVTIEARIHKQDSILRVLQIRQDSIIKSARSIKSPVLSSSKQ